MYKSAAILYCQPSFAVLVTAALKETNLFRDTRACEHLNDLKALIKNGKVDHLFIDLDHKDSRLLSFIKESAQSNKKMFIIVSGPFENSALIFKTKQAGVNAFVSKNFDNMEINDCLLAIYAGKYYVSPNALSKILKEHLGKKSILTPKEMEILQQIKSGKSIIEISAELNLSQYTVISHRRNLMKKMEVDNVTSLVNKAIDLGLI